MQSLEPQLHQVPARDGNLLALTSYQDPSATPIRKSPILFCHGLGANRVSFDPGPEYSIARYFAAQGHRTWILELRGHGLSATPPQSWSLDDYVNLDVGPAIEFVLRESDATQVHLFGHSMGTIVFYTYLATYGGQSIASFIAGAGSIDYGTKGSDYHRLIGLTGLAKWITKLPVGAFFKLVSPLYGRFGHRLEEFMYWLPNMEGAIARNLLNEGFHTIPTPVLLQLSTAFTGHGMTSADGKIRYRERLKDVTTPVFAFTGDKDSQCTVEAIQNSVSAMGSPIKKVVEFGMKNGNKIHYGHFDLLMGKHARKEVYPVIQEWLEQFS